MKNKNKILSLCLVFSLLIGFALNVSAADYYWTVDNSDSSGYGASGTWSTYTSSGCYSGSARYIASTNSSSYTNWYKSYSGIWINYIDMELYLNSANWNDTNSKYILYYYAKSGSQRSTTVYVNQNTWPTGWKACIGYLATEECLSNRNVGVYLYPSGLSNKTTGSDAIYLHLNSNIT